MWAAAAALAGIAATTLADEPAQSGGQTSATRPSTNPAGTFSIQGTVKVGQGFDFGSPDLSRVVVYLDSDPKLDAIPLPSDRPCVAQINKAFVPNFTVVPKGSQVEFPNWDHIAHNVFSRSPAAPSFDLDRYPYGQSKMRQFDKVGVVQIFCNVHPFMRAIIVVTPNMYFTRADADGHFHIDGVPAGSYQVCAWDERCATMKQPVEVGTSGGGEIAFTLDEDRGSILENDPPRHGDNYGVDRGLGEKRERLGLPVVRDSHPAPTSAPSEK
jgi:hypothetical protein